MPRADIRVGLGPRGASLRTIARELRGMDSRKVTGIFKHALEGAARPYPARVRASVLAIPVKEGGKHTGLRARIAGCVELSSGTDAKSAYASVWVNPFRMLPDYVTLPLYMEGVTSERTRYRHDYSRWRHPVFGHSERPWKQQAAHPYFDKPVQPLGRAAGEALKASLEDITRQING
jgi:hypothetical protein